MRVPRPLAKESVDAFDDQPRIDDFDFDFYAIAHLEAGCPQPVRVKAQVRNFNTPQLQGFVPLLSFFGLGVGVGCCELILRVH